MKYATSFNRFRRLADAYVNDRQRTSGLDDEATAHAQQHHGLIGHLLEDIKALGRMLNAWRKGWYQAEKKTMVLLVAALLYLVSPIDAIPDFIPLAGMLDDVFIIGWVLKALRGELDKFTAWENHEITAEPAPYGEPVGY